MPDTTALQQTPPDPLLDGLQRSFNAVLGHDRQMRGRTGIILLCVFMYGVCCTVASYAARIGIMLPIGPTMLIACTIPAYIVFYALVRTGITKEWRDPGLMVVQNIYALVAISFAYVTFGPQERSMVLVLIAVVIVFGMYTHNPAQSMLSGVLTMCLLGASLGVLSKQDPVFYPPDLEFLRFAFMVGTLPTLVLTAYLISSWRNRLAIQRKELMVTLDKVQELATRDSLTGLYNRRYMLDLINNKVERFNRYGEGFTLALIDLDHFKRINDDYGHQTGDQALMAFANAVTHVLRDTDSLARWGGEEFLCLMPNTTPDKAAIALDRIRDALSNIEIAPSAPKLRVKFSAGLAQHQGQDSPDRTIERADHALYEAKSSGRHRSVVAPIDAIEA